LFIVYWCTLRPGSSPAYSTPQKLVLAFVAMFCLVHVAVPTRHFFVYEGNPSWSEEGHLAAWQGGY
jgi:hypothetical protein